MDTARQILRYSIPGSLCLITGVATVFVGQVAAGLSLTAINPATKLETTVALIAASVPVGFVLYQMYYATYGPFVRRRDNGNSYVTRDRGADALGSLPDERLEQLRRVFGARLDVRTWYSPAGPTARFGGAFSVLRLDEAAMRAVYPLDDGASGACSGAGDRTAPSGRVEIDPRCAARIYDDNWRENWSVFRSLLDLAATRADAKELKTEFTTLSDIYHALGAARLAVPAGCLIGTSYVAVVYSSRLLDHPVREAIAAVFLGTACAVLVLILHRARQQTWRSALACAHYGLRWCFETHPGMLQHLDSCDNEFVVRTSLRQPPTKRAP